MPTSLVTARFPLTGFAESLANDGLAPATIQARVTHVRAILNGIGLDPAAGDPALFLDNFALRRFFERRLSGKSLELYDRSWQRYCDYARDHGTALPRKTYDLSLLPLPPDGSSDRILRLVNDLVFASRLASTPPGGYVTSEMALSAAKEGGYAGWFGHHDPCAFYVLVDEAFVHLTDRPWSRTYTLRAVERHLGRLRIAGHVLLHRDRVVVRAGGVLRLYRPDPWPFDMP